MFLVRGKNWWSWNLSWQEFKRQGIHQSCEYSILQRSNLEKGRVVVLGQELMTLGNWIAIFMEGGKFLSNSLPAKIPYFIILNRHFSIVLDLWHWDIQYSWCWITATVSLVCGNSHPIAFACTRSEQWLSWFQWSYVHCCCHTCWCHMLSGATKGRRN